MPHTLTIQSILDRCKRRADKVGNDQHISEEEWLALIGEAVGRLYELAAMSGLVVRVAEEIVTAVSGTSLYALPADHYETISLEYQESATRWLCLGVFAAQERLGAEMEQADRSTMFALSNDSLELLPAPRAGQQYRHRYKRQPPDVTTMELTDTVDLFCPAGERDVIWYVAATAKDIAETDIMHARAERDRCDREFSTWASRQRQALASQQVQVEDRRSSARPRGARF